MVTSLFYYITTTLLEQGLYCHWNVALWSSSVLARGYKRQHHNQAGSSETFISKFSCLLAFVLIGAARKVQLLLKHHFSWKFCISWSCLASFIQLVMSISFFIVAARIYPETHSSS